MAIADIDHGKWCQKKNQVILLVVNVILKDPRVRRSQNGNFRLTLGMAPRSLEHFGLQLPDAFPDHGIDIRHEGGNLL
jgi:hypothetical protein